jgi:hypothetical protein
MAEEMKGRVVGCEGKEVRWMAAISAYVKSANVKAHRRDRRLAGNQSGKRKVVLGIRNAVAIPSRRCSTPKAKPPHSSALALPRVRSFTLTKRRLGTIYMSVSKLSGSTIRKPIHRTVHARIGQKNISVACVVLRSASTTTLQERTFSDTRKNRHGAKITAASQRG